MKRTKKFMMTGGLKNSREACFGGSDNEDFWRAAFVVTIIERLFHELPNQKKFITINIIFLNNPKYCNLT